MSLNTTTSSISELPPDARRQRGIWRPHATAACHPGAVRAISARHERAARATAARHPGAAQDMEARQTCSSWKTDERCWQRSPPPLAVFMQCLHLAVRAQSAVVASVSSEHFIARAFHAVRGTNSAKKTTMRDETASIARFCENVETSEECPTGIVVPLSPEVIVAFLKA